MNNKYYIPWLGQSLDDSLQMRQARFLLITISICLLAFTLLVGESLLVEKARTYLGINLTGFLFTIFLLFLLRWGRIQFVKHLLVWGLLIIVGYNTFFEDEGLRSAATIVYYVLVTLSALLFPKQKVNLIIVAVGAIIVLSYIGEVQGWVSTIYTPAVVIGDLVILLASLSVMAVLQRVHANNSSYLINEYVQANEELAASQKGLQRAHDELEMRVRERTAELSHTNEVLRNEIAMRQNVEKILLGREENLRRYNAALTKLAQSSALAQGNLREVVREITETAVETLKIERASIWFYNKERTKVECWDLYVSSEEKHDSGFTLNVADYPVYFHSLKFTRTIAAVKAADYPLTREFVPLYIENYGIESMLEAPIRNEQTVIGVLCNETVGNTREWTPEEEHFTASLAEFVMLAVQVYERKQVEEALREREEQYRVVAETAEDGIVTINAHNQITFVNRAMENLFGYKAEELMGQSLNKLMPLTLRDKHMQGFDRYLSSDQRHMEWQGINLPGLHKDGRELVIEISFGEFRSDNKRLFTGIIRDVSRRQAQEQALRESEERYRRMIEYSPDGIYISQNEEIKFINQALVELLGANSKADLVGKKCNTIVHPNDREKLKNLKAQDDYIKPTPLTFVRVDGQPLEVEISVATIEYMGQKATQNFVRDLTERRQIEEALRQAQKIESLGLLAGGVAHDFNNLLVAMLGHTSLALRAIPPDQKAHRYITKAVKAAERASDLTRKLLAYSGKGQFEIRSFNLNYLIQENLHLLQVVVPKHIQFKTVLASQLPLIKGDMGQIQQVIMNLLLNAADAIGSKAGTILFKTTVEEIDEDELMSYLLNRQEMLSRGYYVCLSVEDDGLGMAAETLEHIFDPFYSTKDSGHGLGLAAVMGIVRGHKGGIKVQSQLGSGAHFKIILPVAPLQMQTATSLSETAAGDGSVFAGQLILLVDDEQEVRQTVLSILEEEELTILEAADGRTGLQLYQQHQANVDLVLLDLSMPHMSGAELFEKLRTANPNLPIILTSGYSESEATQSFIGQGLAGFLQKPYTASTLLNKIKQYL